MRFLKYFLFVFVLGLFIFFFPQLTKPKESVVILMKKDEFVPEQIMIQKKTKVIFKNEDTKERWPASNLHPTHGIYPEFDPKQPIKIGAEWSFVFDKVGSWKYHDHLMPSLRGTITVTDSFQTPKLSEMTFAQLKIYFTNLANQEGAKVAYEVLKTVNVPPNTDMHLLGHVVGDILYKQQGINGIKICTEDFRNACSHSIVVGIFTDNGEDALPQISQACHQAPGGTGAYTMCFHGLGHGILAFTDYDLEKAIKICQKTNGQAESAQCISGTIMEIISGGDHDKALWSKQRKKYLFANNPFYPCSADFMPEEAKNLCYNYLTPFLWEASGADLNKLTDSDFAKSFALCGQIDQKDQNYKDSCYGGFGKEFTTLAQNKDIRKIDQMSDKQFLKVNKWCKLAQDTEGVNACLLQALSSIYWGGENDRTASIRFCKTITSPDNQKNCFLNLIGQVSNYIKDDKYRQSFCEDLPAEFRAECKRRLT